MLDRKKKMKLALSLFLFAFSISATAQVFRCSEPKGVGMYSTEDHKLSPDGFAGVKPVIILDDKEMRIVWGDSNSAGGTEKVWKAVVFYRSPETVSAVALDANSSGSAVMLYTINIKRGFLYMPSHKDNPILSASSASSFVSTCIN